jgi:hypothetical protein
MFDSFPDMGLATTFLLSLVCGCAGVACAFRIALDLLVVAAGDSLDQSSPEDGGGPYRVWPRDRFKIAAEILILAIFVIVLVGLSYALASRAFRNP